MKTASGCGLITLVILGMAPGWEAAAAERKAEGRPASAPADIRVELTRQAAPTGPDWAAPTTVPGNHEMTLHWLPASGGVIGYCLRYRTSNSSQPWTSVANLAAGATAHTVKGLNNLQSYEFQVGVVDAASNIMWNAKMHARPRGKSHPSGLHGGGQVNAIVKAGGGSMVAGGDVGGFQRSLDGGETWFPSSRGIIRAPGSRGVVSLAYHRTSGTLYGACGDCFYKSTDNAATWTLCHSGNDIAVKATGSTYPRPVGKLVAVDPANVNIVYLGTVKDGIKGSRDGGVTWTALALGGKTVRSLVLDHGLLYAAVEGEGVYRCTTDGSTILLNGSRAPTKPEEIVVLGDNLYVAANTEGIRRLDNPSTASAGAAWTNLAWEAPRLSGRRSTATRAAATT
jgi:hypothetical protein